MSAPVNRSQVSPDAASDVATSACKVPAPVVIAAGGTGGHVVPALAVADVLASRGVPVVWFGTKAGLESRLVPAAGIEMRWIDVAGLRGKGLMGALTGPLRLLRACVQSVVALRALRPRAVLGMGGFVSGPVAVAALLCRRTLVLHEQNAIPGMTNRYLARFASGLFSAWPDVFPRSLDTRVVGNPVHRDIAALAREARLEKESSAGGRGEAKDPVFAEDPLPLRVLVVGGSQGARALNEVVPLATELLGGRVQVHHQTGRSELDAVLKRYVSAEATVRVETFIDDMASAYAEADLVVCRSGAMTVTELAALAVPSILVPFPHAVDDHQTANARRLSDQGAALLISQADLTPARLARELERLHADRPALQAMSLAARQSYLSGAAEAVADALMGQGYSAGATESSGEVTQRKDASGPLQLGSTAVTFNAGGKQ